MKKLFVVLYLLFTALCLTSCKESINDSVVNPVGSGYPLCYMNKGIIINDLSGANAKNISGSSGIGDYYPQWSPDGKYIIYRHDVGVFGPLTYVYKVSDGTYTNVTSDEEPPVRFLHGRLTVGR